MSEPLQPEPALTVIPRGEPSNPFLVGAGLVGWIVLVVGGIIWAINANAAGALVGIVVTIVGALIVAAWFTAGAVVWQLQKAEKRADPA